MENKNIIIILLVIIVILAAAVGVVLSQQMSKEKSNLKIADKSLNVEMEIQFQMRQSKLNLQIKRD